ncbi:MAG: exodeoxyribonuclease VII small subunit [Pirellulales bacterium]
MDSEPTTPPRFEDALGDLEQIVHDLEEGDLGLADSLGRYEKGVRLLKQCHALLEQAERKIEVLSGVDREGNPVAQAFDDRATSVTDKPQARSKRRSAPQKSAGKAPENGPTFNSDVDEPPALF